MITARELRELIDSLYEETVMDVELDMTPVDDAIADAESALIRAHRLMDDIEQVAKVKVNEAFDKSPLVRRLHRLLSDLEHTELHASLNAKEDK